MVTDHFYSSHITLTSECYCHVNRDIAAVPSSLDRRRHALQLMQRFIYSDRVIGDHKKHALQLSFLRCPSLDTHGCTCCHFSAFGLLFAL